MIDIEFIDTEPIFDGVRHIPDAFTHNNKLLKLIRDKQELDYVYIDHKTISYGKDNIILRTEVIFRLVPKREVIVEKTVL
jgi:hypothetical protein